MKNDDLNEQITLQALVSLSVLLIDSVDGQDVDPETAWKFDAQMLSFKLFRHVCSLRGLYQGMKIKTGGEADIEFVDHSSMLVVARAALETYLVFYFVYGAHAEDVGRYRHLTWKYSGLQDRQKFKAITGGNKQKQHRELQDILSMENEIRVSRHFKDLSDKQKTQLLRGEWKIGKSWNDLALEAGFHPIYFNNVYKYLCGYSHSSWASALQIRDAKEIADQTNLARTMYFVGIITLAHFCIAYSELFPAAKEVLLKNERLHELAKYWRFTGEDMKFYDR